MLITFSSGNSMFAYSEKCYPMRFRYLQIQIVVPIYFAAVESSFVPVPGFGLALSAGKRS